MPIQTTDDPKREEVPSLEESSWDVPVVEHDPIRTVTNLGHFVFTQLMSPSNIGSVFSARDDDIVFAHLVNQWHEERGATSSVSEMVECPSYLKIIEMGQKALPLIVAQIRREADDPDHWFAALEAITGDDPVPEAAYGDTVKMAEAWLTWAKERNVE